MDILGNFVLCFSFKTVPSEFCKKTCFFKNECRFSWNQNDNTLTKRGDRRTDAGDKIDGLVPLPRLTFFDCLFTSCGYSFSFKEESLVSVETDVTGADIDTAADS